MSNRVVGKYALGICDRSGQTYKLKDLMPQVKNGRDTGLKVSRSMLDPDQPQLWLGRVTVKDPQAVMGPRPETALAEQRETAWNWSPVGDKNMLGGQYGFSTQDSTQATGEVGSVTVATT